MKAQTQTTPEETWDSDPGTPVIIKLGGDQNDGPIRITSTAMPFDSAVEWIEAKSASPGWIRSLEFNDGACTVSSRPGVLAALEVYQADGKKLFEVSEESVGGSVALKIVSFIGYFQVTKEKESGKAWEESTAKAEFLGEYVKIVFKQRNTETKQDETSLEYTFSSPGVSVIVSPGNN